jgi:uncharacterized protein (TIGR02452 family)
MKQNAKDTLSIVDSGCYTTPAGAAVCFFDAQRAAVAGTRLITPQQAASLVDTLPAGDGAAPIVEVIDARTQSAAQELVITGTDDPLLLNFASGRNVGGGFLNGARAQEEDICRCSGLYRTLETAPGYYAANRHHRDTEYTDHVIYSPRVPFFRVRSRGDLLAKPFCASVVTMPAPNLVSRSNPRLKRPVVDAAFRRRWRIVLAIAVEHGHRTVVLGAWGCGAFGNAPEHAAETALDAVQDPRFAGRIERVVFAIPDSGKVSRRNLLTFRRVLGA